MLRSLIYYKDLANSLIAVKGLNALTKENFPKELLLSSPKVDDGYLQKRLYSRNAVENRTKVEYSAVIPVYKGEDTLIELCSRLKKVFSKLNLSYEIILVDDASPDNSWSVMRFLHEEDNHVKILRLQRNFGQHSAVLCGLNYASGNFVITMDDDLQNPPEEIPKLIETIKSDENVDAVIGIPKEKQHALFRRIGTSLLNMTITYIFKKDPNLRMASFRIMRRSLVDHVMNLKMPEPAIGSMLLLVSTRLKNVEVDHVPRLSGRSGYGLGKIIKLTLNNIINYSSLPLQIVSQIGLISSVLSLLLALYFILRAPHVTVTGWPTIVILLTFFSGLILFTLGIIGEYLIRIIKTVNAYPQFLVSVSMGFDNDED